MSSGVNSEIGLNHVCTADVMNWGQNLWPWLTPVTRKCNSYLQLVTLGEVWLLFPTWIYITQRDGKACLVMTYLMGVFPVKIMVSRYGYQWRPFAFMKKRLRFVFKVSFSFKQHYTTWWYTCLSASKWGSCSLLPTSFMNLLISD